MKREKLDILVQKYMAAESSIDEETLLKSTILGDSKVREYDDLKALFGYYELNKTQTVVPEFRNPTTPLTVQKRKIIGMSWIAVAASVAIIVLAYFFINQNFANNNLDTFSDPKIAAQNATEALQLLSGELNRGGTIAVDQMKEFESLNKYLNIF